MRLIDSALADMLDAEKRVPRIRYPFHIDVVSHDRKIRSYVHRGERFLERVVNDLGVGVTETEVVDPLLRTALRKVVHFRSLRSLYFILTHYRTYTFIKSSARYNATEIAMSGQYKNLPIVTDNVASWYSGLMPYSVWFQSAANIPRKSEVSKLLGVDSKYDRQVLVGGSWETTQYHLQDMAREIQNCLTISRLRSVLSDVLDVLPDLSLEMPHKSDINTVKINCDSKPGLVSGIFSNDKGDAAAWATIAAKKIWDDVYSRRAVYNPCVWSLSGRGRRYDWELIMPSINPELMPCKLDTRLVQVPEFPVHLVEATYQRKLSWSLHDTKVHKNSWFRVGHTMTSGGWGVLHELDQFGEGMEGDWKSFDSLFYKAVVYTSFAVLRSFFPTTHYSCNNFFTFFANSFINRLVVTPGDYIYNLTQGVPSGSIWTSDLDTVGNIIMWMYIFKNYPGYSHLDPVTDIKCLMGGDDFVHAYRKPITFDKEEMISWVKSNTGWLVKDDYLFGPFWNKASPNESLSFYKTILDRNGNPTRRVSEVVKSVNCPEGKPRFKREKFLAQAGFGPPPGEARDALLKMYLLQATADKPTHHGMFREGLAQEMWYVRLLNDECSRMYLETILPCCKIENELSMPFFSNPVSKYFKRSAEKMSYLGFPHEVAEFWLNWTWNSVLDVSRYRTPPIKTYNAKRDNVFRLKKLRRNIRRKLVRDASKRGAARLY